MTLTSSALKILFSVGILCVGTAAAGASQNPGQAVNLRPNIAKQLCLSFATVSNMRNGMLAACDQSNAQKIVMRRTASNLVTMTVGVQCVEAGSKSGDPLTLAKCRNTPSQNFATNSDGQIKSQTGFCVDVWQAKKTAGTPVIGYTCTGGENQRWARYAVQDAGGAPDITVNQMITPKHAPGKCLQVAGHLDTQLAMFDCKGTANQKFSFRWEPRTQIKVNGKCLIDTGTHQVRVGICRDNAGGQLWDVNPNGEIKSRRGLCMDVSGNTLKNGSEIILYQCTGQNNQRFYVRT